MQDNIITESVRQWIESFVVELNLCPFVKRELVNNRVRLFATNALTEEQLLGALQTELELLDSDATVETTLLIHPQVLQDFFDYNEFLSLADSLLVEMGLEGVYQIASFHPNYQFDGTDPNDVENCTNRSPYPMLHLLREDSLEKAIANYPDIDQIPIRNIELMNSMGQDRLNEIMQACKKE
ncbi:MAG: DUF1415 family protein [Gammaproteobacteria bacterium]|nr:MAG: DUF1415 family protein [Gammaproteobacteria bacterium]